MDIPWKEVRGEGPLEECGRTWSVLLRGEELEAVGRINIVEPGVDVRPANYHEAPIEDTDGRGIPAVLEKMQMLRILKERTALTRRGRAWLEDAESCVPARLDSRISWEHAWVASDADLAAIIAM